MEPSIAPALRSQLWCKCGGLWSSGLQPNGGCLLLLTLVGIAFVGILSTRLMWPSSDCSKAFLNSSLVADSVAFTQVVVQGSEVGV